MILSVADVRDQNLPVVDAGWNVYYDAENVLKLTISQYIALFKIFLFFFERYQVTLTMILSNDKLYLYFFMID